MPTVLDHPTSLVARVNADDLDLDRAFREQPLSADVVRCVRTMRDAALETGAFLRDLLTTNAHRDPEITTFLTVWACEQRSRVEVLDRVLRASGSTGRDGRPTHLTVVRSTQGTPRAGALGPLAQLATSETSAQSLAAAHLAWAAIDAWATEAAFRQLASRSRHPVLRELLGRITVQQSRHVEFSAAQAAQLLADDPRAQRLARWALTRLWAPLGSTTPRSADARHLVGFLFGEAEGHAVARRVDQRIDRLPGLAGLSLMTTNAAAAAAA
jgi:hypothetical protein